MRLNSSISVGLATLGLATLGLATLGLATLGLATPASAQEHRHDHESEALVEFPVSCTSPAQDAFERSVAALHSFGYEEARLGFEAVLREDPACAMGHWGVAMALHHPLWAPPTPAELAAGSQAARSAARVGAPTERERRYIAAINAFYADADRLDHRNRAAAYRDAMSELTEAFPDEDEASIFFALAILGAAPPSDGSRTAQRRAAAILDRQLRSHPRHPGIAHYTIHAFDYPDLADLALPAARVYAELAPESAHARHMPTHIFTRLGLWEESIDANIGCRDVALERVGRVHGGGGSFEAMHCQDYMAYAYLQLGDDTRAREVLEHVVAPSRFDDPNQSVAYAVLAVPARYALERGDWEAAAGLDVAEVDVEWENFPQGPGITHFANAVGAARAGDTARARRAVERLERLHARLSAEPPAGPYDWAGQVESAWLAAAGWLAHAEGRPEPAVEMLRRAADKEDVVGKHPVTPGPVLPARELLGDLLMELGRPAEALAAYEATLDVSPRRFNATLGAARAARDAGRPEAAQTHYRALVELAGASTDRASELAEARAFVGVG